MIAFKMTSGPVRAPREDDDHGLLRIEVDPDVMPPKRRLLQGGRPGACLSHPSDHVLLNDTTTT